MEFIDTQRLILDARIEHSVIRGTLIVPSGDSRDFHGWLEPNTALEACLETNAQRAPISPREPAVAVLRHSTHGVPGGETTLDQVSKGPEAPSPSLTGVRVRTQKQ